MDEKPDELVVRLGDSLVRRKAGQSAAEQARASREAAPVRTMLARVLGVHTDERAWRKGAEGERIIGRELDRLDADVWHVFHDVPIGENGANVDHVVIGPAGIFTVNAKNCSGKLWIGERAILHNGHKTDWLRKSRYEAQRASKLLGTATGAPVMVRPVLAVAADEITVKARPADVVIKSRRTIRKWLLAEPAVLDRQTAFAIATKAHRPSTWSTNR